MLYPAELRVQTLPFSRNVFGCLSLTGPRRILLWLCREDRTRTCDPLVPNQMRYHLRHFPNLYATFLSGKTGTRTQGTLPRPQLSRLLHYHSAIFPIGSANLDRKSICAIVFKQIINWLLSINLWVRYSNVIHSSYKALEGIAYRVDFLHGNRSIIKLTSC